MLRAPSRKGSGPRLLGLLGPAFVAAIAYVDPGNVAANLTAGAQYGYLLVWVLVVANAMAVLVQYLSAKLGAVTGRSLPHLLGQRLGRRGRLAFWLQAEVVAAATDLAEVIGGAVALNLLFGTPLLLGGILVGIVSTLVLVVQDRRGQRTFEGVLIALLVLITCGFVAGLVVAPPDWGGVAGGLVPRFRGADTVLLAASMLGATVMPHAIYLHSALVVDRHGPSPAGSEDPSSSRLPAAARPAGEESDDDGLQSEVPRVGRVLRAARWDVVLALAVAGSVNIALLLLAAANLRGAAGTDSIEGAHAVIDQALGPAVAAIFAVGLLVSGLASTSVGCYAGSVIMGGLLRRRVPLLLRRVLTLVPALLVLALGADPTRALVVSQALLSLGIPCAMIPLVRYTSDRAVMGRWTNPAPIRVLAWAVCCAVVVLNLALVVMMPLGLG